MRRLFAFALLLAHVLATAAPAAAADAIHLPPVTRTTLANGLRVILLPVSGLPLVDFRLVLDAGSGLDPQGKEGLAGLTADLLTQGTPTRTATAIAEEAEFVGGTLSASSGLEQTVVQAEFLSGDFELGLDLVADVTLRPKFAADEFARAKTKALGRIESDKDDPSTVAAQAFARAFYGAAHPFGHPSGGTAAGVGALTRDDVVSFHDRTYRPNRAWLVVVGGFDAARAKSAIAKKFGAWKAGEAPASPAGSPSERKGARVVLVSKPDATQTQIRMGAPGLPRNHPDRFPLLVANTILGGGFTSRLVSEVRVKRGLSYSISSRFEGQRATGAFVVSTFTKNETARQTIDVTLEELRKFRDQGATAEEIQKAKNYLKGQFPLSIEAPDDLAQILGDIAFFALAPDYIEGYWSRVDAVTAEDVKRVTRQYIPESGYLFVAVSNPEQVKAQLESLGPLEVRPLE